MESFEANVRGSSSELPLTTSSMTTRRFHEHAQLHLVFEEADHAQKISWP